MLKLILRMRNCDVPILGDAKFSLRAIGLLPHIGFASWRMS